VQYKDVPKDLAGNKHFREDLLKACRADSLLRAGVRELCSRDLLFWVNTFLWTFDPRKIDGGDSPHIPFITWPFQDEVLWALEKHLGKDDVGIEKSRDMGASWMCLLVFLHQWQFRSGRAFMLVSRKEGLVDSPSDPDSLFWKLDYLLNCQPPFLVPKYQRTKLHLENLENGSNIDGASTTGDAGRGGRRTAFMIDEAAAFEPADGYAINAATADNTNCRIWNSTYQGSSGVFYDQMQRPDIARISLHWTSHPEKMKGAYKTEDGKVRSPAYDAAYRKIVSPAQMAQEWDMNPAGSASPFFPPEVVDGHIQKHARPPVMKCRWEVDPFNPKKTTLTEDDRGQLLLWTRLHPYTLKPEPSEQYIVGVDISAGTGATNSTLTIVERKTREKVGELASARLSPEKFAECACTLAWHFNEAFLIWELNGTAGGVFGKRVLDLGYRNLYYRRDEQGREHKLSKGLVPGWFSSPHNKALMLGKYRAALSEGTFTNRSRESLIECRLYHYMPNGTVENARARAFVDQSGAGQNHGDRVIADALANHALGVPPELEKPHDDPNSLEGYAEPYSWKWRRQKAAREADEQRYDRSWETPAEYMRGWETPPEIMRGFEETPESMRGW
jgi:hypothetical protein